MDKPFKIIFKFKNNQNVYQHFLYIFVGRVPNNLEKTIKKFKNLNFIDTLKIITKEDYALLTKYYTEEWYKYFFISYHLDYTLKQLQEKNQHKQDKDSLKNGETIKQYLLSLEKMLEESERLQDSLYTNA